MVSSEEGKNKQLGVKELQEREKNYNAMVFKVLKVALIVVAVGAIVLSWPTFFSQTAKVKRSFKKGVGAFETGRIVRVMDFISEDYKDVSGNTREQFELYLPIVFDKFKDVSVKISKMQVEFDDPQIARISVEGSIFLKRPDDSLIRFKTEDPATIYMVKEDRWRLYSIKDLDFNIEDLEEAESMF